MRMAPASLGGDSVARRAFFWKLGAGSVPMQLPW